MQLTAPRYPALFVDMMMVEELGLEVVGGAEASSTGVERQPTCSFVHLRTRRYDQLTRHTQVPSEDAHWEAFRDGCLMFLAFVVFGWSAASFLGGRREAAQIF